MYIIYKLKEALEEAHELHKLRTVQYKLQLVQEKNGHEPAKDVEKITKKDTEDSYWAVVILSILAFLAVVLWIWALVLLIQSWKYLSSIEKLVLILIMIFGIGIAVIIYLQVVVKKRVKVAPTGIQ